MTRRLVLQDFLPYLLNRAGMKIGAMFSRDIEPYDVTLPMWRVLLELWHKGDHRLGELAQRTSIDLSTLSRLLVSMQRRRLVARKRSGLDRRALSLTLTAKGLKLVREIAPYAAYYEKLAMENLNADEVVQLKNLLRKVFGSLEAANRKSETGTPPAKQQPKTRPRAPIAKPRSKRSQPKPDTP